MKRGLSGIITVILLILITIIAISIVWLFVKPSIDSIIGGENGDGQINRLAQCVDVKIQTDFCFEYDTDVEVKVVRGAGIGNIDEIKFRFQTNNGDIILSSNDASGNIPGEFGSSTFLFDKNLFEGLEIINVDIAFILGDNVCGFTGSPSLCTSSLTGGGGEEKLMILYFYLMLDICCKLLSPQQIKLMK